MTATRQRALAPLIVALASGSAWLLAQDAPQTPPVFRADTDVVRLEVGVLDRDRRPVRDLTAADFVVLENGRERPVVAFTSVELPAAAPDEARTTWIREAPRDVVTNAAPSEGRLVAIAFDWSIRNYDQALARAIAHAAIDGLGPADHAAVLFTEGSAAAGVPQNFTADRTLLRAAIDQPFGTAMLESPFAPGNENRRMIMDPERLDSGDCLCGTCTLSALTRIADVLKPVSDRRKVVLFIGTFVRTYETIGGIGPRNSDRGGFALGEALQPGACSVRLRDARRALDDAMAEANASIHVLDPVGLESAGNTPLGSARRIRERQDGLPILADLTGGRTVMNTNEPEAHVGSILDESSSYYVLGFTPTSTVSDGRTNRIEVRVRRPGTTVTARDRYTRAEVPAAIVESEDATLARTMGGVLPSAALPIDVSVVPLLTSGDPGAAAFIVGRLSAQPDAPPDLTFLSAAFTPRGRSVTSKRVTLRPEDVRAGADPLIGLVSGLPLEPGPYEVRVAVEGPAATGSVHAFVDVPDFARDALTLSGVLLHVAPEEATAPREEVDGLLPFVPTARRTFTATDVVSAFLQVSQGTRRSNRLEVVGVQIRILNAEGAEVRAESMDVQPDRFTSNRSTNVRFSVPTRDLAAGHYLLTIDARVADHSATRTVRFEIR